MPSFSERYGYKPMKAVVQIETIDDDLRISLWNELNTFYWNKVNPQYVFKGEPNKGIHLLVEHIWSEYFKLPTDSISYNWDIVYKHLKEYFFSCHWNEVYDFIEFVADNYYDVNVDRNFRKECNRVLKREVSGYRYIGDKIAQITSEEEIAEIEEALTCQESSAPVSIHLKSALDFFTDKKEPDYRNSIKESISAVEAICRLIAGSEATLGKALGEIRREGKIELHVALTNAFEKLYDYTSDEGGIRHSLLEEPTLDFEDAKFMLVSCSAFINYLKEKAVKAGINLTS